LEIIVKQANNCRFISGQPHEKLLHDPDRDLNDLFSLCYEHDTNRILLYAANLPDGFCDLSTGIAGQILQKCAQYQVRLAIVIPPETKQTDTFRHMVQELNQTHEAHIAENDQDAVDWLTRKE